MKADAEYAGLGVYIFRFLLIDRVSCLPFALHELGTCNRRFLA